MTDLDGLPSAVLIRALQLEAVPPWIGPQEKVKLHRLAAGPGKLCQTLNIDRSLNGSPLQPNSPLWLEHRHPSLQQQLDVGQLTLTQTTRIGLTEGIELPWRWYLTNCPAVSKKG